MGLLLKSLKQIDWRPAEAPAEEENCAVVLPVEEAPLDETVLDPEELQSTSDVSSEEQSPQLAADEQLQPEALAEEAVTEEAILEDTAELELPQEPQEADELLPEPEAIELPPAREPEIQTAESTLERLNELHALIDAALEGFSSGEPIVVEPPKADPSDSAAEVAAEELGAFEATVKFSPVDASPDTVVPPPAIFTPIEQSEPASWVPNLRLRDEYRELRDHLLSRFPLDQPCTLLAIDAGRATCDASWLAPFAACLWESLSEQPSLHLSASAPKILLVEAAGPECGIARQLGLACPKGLNDVLHGKADLTAAVQPTYHPQIELLSCGRALVQPRQSEQLRELWGDLQQQYQVILVAAGPWEAVSQASWRKSGMSTAAMLLPLADAAVLCVELDGTPQSAALDTKQALERRGVRLLGSVVSGQ